MIVRQLWPLTPNVERAAIGWRRAAFGFSPWRILCKRGQAVPIEIRFRIHEDCIPRVRQFEFIGKSIPVGVETRAGGELAGPLVDVATRKTLVCNEIKGKGFKKIPILVEIGLVGREKDEDEPQPGAIQPRGWPFRSGGGDIQMAGIPSEGLSAPRFAASRVVPPA